MSSVKSQGVECVVGAVPDVVFLGLINLIYITPARMASSTSIISTMIILFVTTLKKHADYIIKILKHYT